MTDYTELITGIAFRFVLQIPMVLVVVFVVSTATYYLSLIQAAVLGVFVGLIIVAILSIIIEILASATN